MPRDGSGIYTRPYPNVVSGTRIESAVDNGTVSDIETDLNAARPIIAGGTGASNADQALVNMSGEKAAQLVTNYNSQLWMPGSFRSAAAATGAPNATSSFVGTAYINEALAYPPTNQNVVIEARDQNDTTIPGRTYVREKKAGTWGAWTGGIYAAPFDAMAYNGMQVNGGMEVSQENGTSGVATTSTTKHILDGWRLSSVGAHTVVGQQSGIAAPIGKALEMWVSTANSTPAPNDYVAFSHLLEGYRVSRLLWGTASASAITISFWVRAVRTGLYSGGVKNFDSTRNYVFTFTVNASVTWEYKSITIPGDTGGTWKKDHTIGMQLWFAIMAGSSMVTTPNVWAGVAALGATGTVNGIAATSDGFLLSNVIVLPGAQAPTVTQSPLIMRPYDQELVTCQRYWQSTNLGVPKGGSIGTLNGNTFGYQNVVFGTWPLAMPMRANPTITLWNNGTQNQVRDDQSGAVVAATFTSASAVSLSRIASVNFSGTPLTVQKTYGFDLQLDARL